jgi:hypothetical protein
MATGEPKRKPEPTHVDGIPGKGVRTRSVDVHKDAWKSLYQDPSTYLTTVQLAKDLGEWASSVDGGRVMPYPESIYRWCKQWFGPLPPGRTGPSMGYRIPPAYRYIARVWYLTENPEIRQTAREALLNDGSHQKPWVVVVANLGSTHYTDSEVASRVHSLLTMSRQRNRMIHAFYVGDKDDG